MILISNDFWHNRKMYNFDPYNVLLAISTNITAAYDCLCASETQIPLTKFLYENYKKATEVSSCM